MSEARQGTGPLAAFTGGTGTPEALPETNEETDRVREKVSEGFHLIESGQVVLRGAEAVSLWLLDIRECESTGSLAAQACG